MSTDDVQTNLRFPVKLKERLQEVARASGRTLTAEVVHRLEESLGQPSLNRHESDGEVWEQLRTMRARETALRSQRITLQQIRDDLEKNAPRNQFGGLAKEAEEQAYRITSDIYEIEAELRAMSKRMDEAYDRAAGMAPGAGRSWS